MLKSDNLISRAAAIDAARKCAVKEVTPAYMLIDKAEVMTELMKLPSAQPEIIRCRECKHYYFADNRIPQEQRYVCDIGGEVWQPDDFCSYGERREEGK